MKLGKEEPEVGYASRRTPPAILEQWRVSTADTCGVGMFTNDELKVRFERTLFEEKDQVFARIAWKFQDP